MMMNFSEFWVRRQTDNRKDKGCCFAVGYSACFTGWGDGMCLELILVQQ